MQSRELEKDIVSACMQYLSLVGIFHWRQNQGAIPLKGGGYRAFNGMRGLSDIIGIMPDGRFLAVEVKRPGEKMSEHQEAFQTAIAERGGVATCVTSAWELQKDIEEALSKKNR